MKVLRLTIGLVCFFFFFSPFSFAHSIADPPPYRGNPYAFNRALQALRQEYQAEKQALLEEKQQDIEAVKAGFAEQKEELQATLDELGQEEQEAIAAVEEGYAGQIQELKDQIDDLKEAKSEVLKALRKEFISELLTAIKEGKFGDIIGIVKDYIADRKEVKQTFAEQIQEVQEQLAGVEEEKQLAIDEVKDAFTEERQDIQDQIAALEQGEQEAIAAIEEEYEGNLAELKDEYKDKITELWHEYFGEDSQPPERIFKKFFKEPKAPKGKDRHKEGAHKDKDRGERSHRDEDDAERNHATIPGEIGDIYIPYIPLPDHPNEDGGPSSDGRFPPPGGFEFPPWMRSCPTCNDSGIPFVPGMAGRSDKYLDLRR